MRTYLRVLAYGKPYFWMGGLAIGALFLYTLFNTFSLLSAIPFLEILFFQQGAVPAPPETSFSWLDAGSWKDHAYYQLLMVTQEIGPIQMLWYFCGILFLTITLKSIFRYTAAWFISPLEQGIMENMRNHLFSHTSSLGLSFYTKKRKGDMISTMVSDVQVVQEAITGTAQSVIREPIMMVFLLITLIFISWQLTLFVLFLLPATGYFINRISRSLRKRGRRGQDTLSRLVSTLDEFISGIRIVKAFQSENYEQAKYQQHNRDYTRTMVGIRRRVDSASPVSEILSIGVICLIILYAGHLILEEGAYGPRKAEFIGFLVIFSQLLSPIKTFSNSLARIQKGIAAYQRIELLLDEKPHIQEVEKPLSLEGFHEEIRFEDIHFSYPNHPVLHGVSFSVKKGQTVALVGPSGAGKSTLVDLIPRFYDPAGGSILIDGKDIRQVKIADLRALIGNVTQEGILFHDTVFANIAYGQPETALEKVMEAAKMAHAHEFIQELPEGYQTVIGERGTALSGGQRQRLSIARAILRDPDVLILDEATSNLDTASERLVQDALTALMEDRTSIVIAHRLSTILQADEILVLEAGKIIERGRHQDLLLQNGLYRTLFDMQFQS